MHQLPYALFALRVPETALPRDKKLPERLKFLKWGRNDTTKGPFIVDEHTVSVLPLNQRNTGFDQVALDFEHNTVPGTAEYKRTQEPRPVAGHGKIEVVPGEGLFITSLSYTPTGEQNFFNYIDPSGAVAKDDQDRVIFVHSVALTHTGSAPDVHLLSAAPLAAGNQQPAESNRMNRAEIIALMASLIGLPAAATEADLQAKLKTLSTAQPFDAKPLEQQLTALSADLKALKEQMEKGAKAATDAEKSKVVALFAQQGKAPVDPTTGKAYTVEALSALDVTTLNAILANTPATVPLSARAGKPAENTDPNLKGAERAAASWAHLEK